ncbi:MAG: ABC transporter substrate-binding protein [Tissierellaceae bacterium]|nr:ABC transporter substrate-binding protein [Tissierellaceae bacterium]
MKTKKIIALVLSLMMLTVFVVGCSNDSSTSTANNDTNNNATNEPSNNNQEEPSSEPKIGGDLVVGLSGDPYSLATWNSNDMNSSLVMNLVLPALMVTDENGNKVPYVVKEYSISDDAKEYTLTIHEGMNWHDGTPFTTADLEFTAKYVVEHSLGFGADMYANVESMEIIDDTTIIYRLVQPQVNFLSQMGFWVDIMPKHVFESVDDPANFAYDGLGFGPYKVKEYVKGQYYTLERNEDWPLTSELGGPFLDTITFRVFPDANALVLAIKNGEVQVSGSSLPVAAQKQLEADPDNFGVMKVDSLGFGYLSFNYRNEILADQNVRLAFAKTIDRNALVNIALQGGATIMETPISPVFKDLVASNIKYPELDIQGAAGVLEAAGYKDSNNDGVRESADGKALEFALSYRTTSANIDSVVNIIKANAEEAGFKITLQPLDPATYTDRVVKQGNFDMNVIEWGVIDDADTSLSTIYRSDSALNFMAYKNEKIDALLDASQIEPSYQKRIEIMNEFQEEFVKELPSLNLWVRNNAYGYSKAYGGWDLTPGLYGVLDVKDIVNVYEK